MFGRRVPVESHSSFAASRLPASLDPLRNASTFTLSNWAPVACTATSVAGLCPVEPGSGTVVTSAISCLFASAAEVVVVVAASACLVGHEPLVEKTPVRTTTATTAPTSTNALLSTTAVLPAVCPCRTAWSRRAALPPTRKAYERPAANRTAPPGS